VRARDWKGPFLEALRGVPNIAVAARTVGVDRTTVYAAWKRDEAFHVACMAAIEDAADRFEGEVAKRILQGTTQERTREEYDGDGKLVRRTVERTKDFDDRTLFDYLAAIRPEKWGKVDLRKLSEIVVGRAAGPGRADGDEPAAVDPGDPR
jgi:hypothetical protein